MKRSPIPVILRAVLISVVAAVLTTVGVFVAAFVIFPMKELRVSGNQMLGDSEVSNLIPNRASLLTLNSSKLEHTLEKNPWVEEISVSKNWSNNELVVKVDERTAILYTEVEGVEAILSLDGKELPSTGGKELEKISMSRRQVEQTLKTSRAFAGSEPALQSIYAVDSEGIHAVADGRRVLYSDGLDREQVRSLSGVMSENPQRAVFDLRSGGRIVVRPDASEEADSGTDNSSELKG